MHVYLYVYMLGVSICFESFLRDHSRSWNSICSLLGALKNTTPSSGEMSLFEESSAQAWGIQNTQLDKIIAFHYV